MGRALNFLPNSTLFAPVKTAVLGFLFALAHCHSSVII